MQKTKGYKYDIQGFSDLDKFAKGVLALANLKSSNKGIIDFTTHAGSNDITIIATENNESYLEEYVGEVKSKKEIDVYSIEYDNLSTSAQKLTTKLEDEYRSEERRVGKDS